MPRILHRVSGGGDVVGVVAPILITAHVQYNTKLNNRMESSLNLALAGT